nr:hypothetical protein [Cytophagales bacterium]
MPFIDLTARLTFDFGRYAIPDRYFEMDWMEGFEMINSQGFAAITDYFKPGDLQVIVVDLQVAGDLSRQLLVWDGEEGTKRVSSLSRQQAFENPVGIVGNQLVFIAQAAHVLDLNTGNLPLDVQPLRADDNPALLFVDLSDL